MRRKMNELVGRMLWLEQYRCRRCDRSFYIESGDRGCLEWDFGCPYLCPEEFELSMGRKPKSHAEFDQWAALAEKGLLNGHIDWDILYDCTCDAMTNYGGDEK